MSVYPNPKIGIADKVIVDFFKTKGVDPHVDYLADRGRTRVLNFSVPDDVQALGNLCERIFVDIYGIRWDDILKFSPRSLQELGLTG